MAIPITGLGERDRFKKGNDVLNRQARAFIRELDKLSADHRLTAATVLFRELVRGHTTVDDEERLLQLLGVHSHPLAMPRIKSFMVSFRPGMMLPVRAPACPSGILGAACASTAEASSPEDAHRHLADLICLTRPVTINSFANAIGESVEVAERFCDGMVPGLLLEGEAVAFRDEDFETYVRSKLTANDELESHRRLADRLMAERTTDEFAATTCAEHLFLAGEHSALVELAVSPDLSVVGWGGC